MLADDIGFYLRNVKSNRDVGIYLAQVTVCRPECAEGETHIGVCWSLQIVTPATRGAAISWRAAIKGMEGFEELSHPLSILGIRLEHVDEIEDACARAVGKQVFIEIMRRGGLRMLHRALPLPSCPPFWDRLNRAQAIRLCKRRGLTASLEGLNQYRFPDERQRGESGRAPVLRPLGRRGRGPRKQE